MSLSIPFLFGVAAEQKATRVEVNILLAFLHWVGIAQHPLPFVSDITSMYSANISAVFLLPFEGLWDLNVSFIEFARWRHKSGRQMTTCLVEIAMWQHRGRSLPSPLNLVKRVVWSCCIELMWLFAVQCLTTTQLCMLYNLQGTPTRLRHITDSVLVSRGPLYLNYHLTTGNEKSF